MSSIALSFTLVLSCILIPLFVGSVLIIFHIGYQNVSSQDIVLGSDRNIHLNMSNHLEDGCNQYINTLQIHPYLAATHNNCFKLNELQLLGNRLDWENQKLHRVGIFGGSVASQFASFDGNSYFQELLNQCITDKGDSTEFSVLNFADGSWKHPSQSIALILYGDYLDTAISIEGFNEHYMVGSHLDLVQPSSNFAVAARNAGTQIRLKLLDNMFHFVKGTWLENLSSTKLFLLAVRSILINSIELSQTAMDENIPLENMATFKPASVDNLDRYKSFVKSFLNIAESKNISALVFLQPAPIYKQLTDAEKIVVRDTSYEKKYELLRSATSISPRFVDLSDMFINNSETIFGDDIHFLSHEGDSFGRSHGDRMLSEKVIVEMLKNYPKKFEIKASCLGLLKNKN